MMNSMTGSAREEGRRITRVQGGLAVVVLAGLAYVMFLWGDGGPAEPLPEPATVSVEVEAVEVGQLRPVLEADGVVESGREAWLSSETGGRVIRSAEEIGVVIAAGEEIVAFDSEPAQIAVDRATAARQLADLAVQHAQREWVRVDALYAAGDVTDSARDGTRLSVEDAKARATDALAAEQAARRGLAETVVRAPWRGTLAEVGVNAGAMVPGGHPVARLVDMDDLRVVIGVSAADAAAVTEGDSARIEIAGAEAVSATVRWISVTPDPMSRTYRVAISTEGLGGRIGQGAKVDLIQDAVLGIVIPLSAVVFQRDSAHAFVVEGDHAVRRALVLGERAGGRVHIRRGLVPGDRLVVVGQSGIVDGELVSVREGR